MTTMPKPALVASASAEPNDDLGHEFAEAIFEFSGNDKESSPPVSRLGNAARKPESFLR